MQALHSDLINALRTLDEQLPEWVDGPTAWKMLNPRPDAVHYRYSFWAQLRDKLLFSKTTHRQKALASWIWDQKKYARQWPPIAITTNRPVHIPAPTPLQYE